tara:strand:- start:43182 stop:43820 length:639 start_codon:yes stop_codon:yes gene_type:complete
VTFFLQWILMAAVQLAATMSPGPAFVVAVRNAMAYNRPIGILTALGLACGVAAHVIFVLAGISFLIAKSVFLFNFIKYAGAAYLFYIGVKALIFSKKKEDTQNAVQNSVPDKPLISGYKAVLNGFLTNLLNPKAVVFFTAVYTQFIDLSTPVFMHLAYGVTSVAIEFLWFAGVAIVLTNPAVKSKFMKIMHWIERGCGGLMIGLGVKLALTK